MQLLELQSLPADGVLGETATQELPTAPPLDSAAGGTVEMQGKQTIAPAQILLSEDMVRRAVGELLCASFYPEGVISETEVVCTVRKLTQLHPQLLPVGGAAVKGTGTLAERAHLASFSSRGIIGSGAGVTAVEERPAMPVSAFPGRITTGMYQFDFS